MYVYIYIYLGSQVAIPKIDAKKDNLRTHAVHVAT